MCFYPHPTLTPIPGRPTLQDLKRLRMELVENAMSIHSLRGGGQHGHLGLILPPDEYITLIGTPFDVPQQPRQRPQYADDATDVQIYNANAAYDWAVTEFLTYNSTKNTLLAQLLVAVKKDYYYELCDPMFGFGMVTPMAILTHLITTYGQET